MSSSSSSSSSEIFVNTSQLADYNLPDTEIIFDAQFHPQKDGWIGFSTVEGDVQLVNFDNGKAKNCPDIVTSFSNHHKGSSVRKLRFNEDGTLLFSAAKTVKVTDLTTSKVVRKIEDTEKGSKKKKIYSLLIADEYLLCVGDDEGGFTVWDYRTERPAHLRLSVCEGYLSDLDIDSARKIVVASSGEGTLTAFNLRAKRMEEPQSELFDAGFQTVRYLEEKGKVVVGAEDGALNLFNIGGWGNISDRFPVKKSSGGAGRNAEAVSIDCMEVLESGEGVDENLLVVGASDGTLQAKHRSSSSSSSSTTLGEGIECVDVHQVAHRVVATTGATVKLLSYEVIRSAASVKRLKKGASFFDGLEAGSYIRHHQHFLYSKAMCPEKDKVFVHSRVSPTTMYICSSVFNSQTFDQNNDVFVYPIMAVKDF
ncbi:WD domain repeat-containing protein 55 [Tyrophagus putrescentiae]|nr:WD domain repeat-containing protein 55 [Tyrophagus putrescentiae]